MIGLPHCEGAAVHRRPPPHIANRQPSHLPTKGTPMLGPMIQTPQRPSALDRLYDAQVEAQRADSWATDPTRFDDDDDRDEVDDDG